MKALLIILLLCAASALADEPQEQTQERDTTARQLIDRHGNTTQMYVAPVHADETVWVERVWDWWQGVLSWYEGDH